VGHAVPEASSAKRTGGPVRATPRHVVPESWSLRANPALLAQSFYWLSPKQSLATLAALAANRPPCHVHHGTADGTECN
jgi:hypothetical protein